MTETFTKGSEESVREACKEDGSTPNQGRYSTMSEVFLQPNWISISKKEDVSMGGGSDSMQRSNLECVLVVDYSL